MFLENFVQPLQAKHHAFLLVQDGRVLYGLRHVDNYDITFVRFKNRLTTSGIGLDEGWISATEKVERELDNRVLSLPRKHANHTVSGRIFRGGRFSADEMKS